MQDRLAEKLGIPSHVFYVLNGCGKVLQRDAPCDLSPGETVEVVVRLRGGTSNALESEALTGSEASASTTEASTSGSEAADEVSPSWLP